MLKKIEEEIALLEKIKVQSNAMIKCAPDGKLRCAINKGYYQYYCGNTYLGDDKKEYIKQVAQKEYCTKLNKNLEKRLQKLKELKAVYKDNALEAVYRDLHPGRKCLVEPLVRSVEEIIDEFENIQYKGKEFSEDDETAYLTMKGERVRSKSEKIIADELFRYRVPYKYEMPVELKEGNKKVIFYSDFTALNRRTGKKWIIEHFGLLDRMSYFESTMRKLDIYERNEILLGESLILLHETSNYPLNTRVLRSYIETYLI